MDNFNYFEYYFSLLFFSLLFFIIFIFIFFIMIIMIIIHKIYFYFKILIILQKFSFTFNLLKSSKILRYLQVKSLRISNIRIIFKFCYFWLRSLKFLSNSLNNWIFIRWLIIYLNCDIIIIIININIIIILQIFSYYYY